MPITVGSPVNLVPTINSVNSVWSAKGTLPISGLTAGANNTVPHGLPRTPRYLSYRGLGWSEQQSPDTTNLYINVAAGGSASGEVDFDYPTS